MAEGEFAFIARRMRPLAQAPGALGLRDDAALLDPHPGMQLVLAKDAMVAGVHFLQDDPAGQIAQKLLRVNLSDLAAMGAAPIGYLLALARAPDTDDDWLAAFSAGLATDNAAFGISVLGGDTVSTPGPLTLSLTAIGEVPRGQALLRSGAKAGDDIWVSGTLGDAALGLAVLQGKLDVREQARAHLVERYRLPQPRLALGQALRGLAHAAIDVSDGLLADLGHIANASGVAIDLRRETFLLPGQMRDAAAALGVDPYTWLLSGGDDHALAATFPAGPGLPDRWLVVGQVQDSAVPGVTVDGRVFGDGTGGWDHFR
jgi:thiamine-monophosphate kinase